MKEIPIKIEKVPLPKGCAGKLTQLRERLTHELGFEPSLSDTVGFLINFYDQRQPLTKTRKYTKKGHKHEKSNEPLDQIPEVNS